MPIFSRSVNKKSATPTTKSLDRSQQEDTTALEAAEHEMLDATESRVVRDGSKHFDVVPTWRSDVVNFGTGLFVDTVLLSVEYMYCSIVVAS